MYFVCQLLVPFFLGLGGLLSAGLITLLCLMENGGDLKALKIIVDWMMHHDYE